MCQGAAPLIALWIAGYSLVFLSAAGSGLPHLDPAIAGVPWLTGMVLTPVLHFKWFPRRTTIGVLLSLGLVAPWLAGLWVTVKLFGFGVGPSR